MLFTGYREMVVVMDMSCPKRFSNLTFSRSSHRRTLGTVTLSRHDALPSNEMAFRHVGFTAG